MNESDNELVDLLSMSIELCIRLAEFFPETDLCDQLKDIFYEQAYFITKRDEEIKIKEYLYTIYKYEKMIEEVIKIKNET